MAAHGIRSSGSPTHFGTCEYAQMHGLSSSPDTTMPAISPR